MTNKLIEKTNSDKFYQNCNFYLESKHLITSQNRLELIFSINQASYDILVEYEEWKIVCNNPISSKGLDHKFLMPYVKIAILKEHPLLWQFNEDINECYIQGVPNNIKEFYGELAITLEKETGNWIKLTDKMWNLEHWFKKDTEKYISLSDSMKDIFESICNNHNLDFQIKKKKTGKDKEYENRSNSQLLIFGNEKLSPHNFNLKQPYIIADHFEFIRI